MLDNFVSIIRSHNNYIEDGTLTVEDVLIDSNTNKLIQFFDDTAILENHSFTRVIGTTISLDLSLTKLTNHGYYQDIETFIAYNRSKYPETPFYIREIDKFDIEDTLFLKQYQAIIFQIDTVKKISKHTFSDTEVDYVVIYRDDKSIIIPLFYEINHVKGLSLQEIKCINSIAEVFNDANSEKKILYINELIDFCGSIDEELRFSRLLETSSDFKEKCDAAYQYYLRDFSYNKLKFELDSKALEFTQKIQSVINDSQTKLIAIPTAFVLVFTALDFDEINSIKNIASIIGLLIFSVIIQIFLNNQFSSLAFIKINVESYKKTFSRGNMGTFTKHFEIVYKELLRQRNRLYIVAIILWLIPIILIIAWLSFWGGIQIMLALLS